MYKKTLFICLMCLICFSVMAQTSSRLLFDKGWRFYLGGAQGAEVADFNDTHWREVDLPHDWSIENRPGSNSPFNLAAISQVSGGFTTGGIGWYRKSFTIPATDKGKHLILQFDGVYMNSDVWINGQHLGNHPYGYTSFIYDLTKYLKFGDINVIAVQVKNEGQNSRWYSGSGIYRHVWLKTVEDVHVGQWGTTISTPEVNLDEAKVVIRTLALNQSDKTVKVKLVTQLISPSGIVVSRTESTQSIPFGSSFDYKQEVSIGQPILWSPDSAALYKAVTGLYVDGRITDREENSFGIRSISIDVNHGLMLNGKPIKLKGGCFHDDNGPLGAKAYDRAEQRKVELLKASGFNAIRCSHNPPSPAFLNACDSLGLLVIDEAFDMWNVGKNPYDYHLYFKDWWQKDVESMISRDKNHPSIIMWSIGNEIPEKASPEGVATAKMLADYVRNADPTRAVTAAVNDLHEDKDPFFAALDVGGYNYAAGGSHHKEDIYAEDHKRVPSRIMFGTESYPIEAFQSWMAVLDHPYVVGDFVWTAWDYIGEASLGQLGYPQNADFYPWNLAFCGDIDICGWKRPQSYYRDALWKSNQLSVFVKCPKPNYKSNPKLMSWSKWNWDDVAASWNWPGSEGKPLEIHIYSSCSEVELFLNNKSLGRKPTNRGSQFMAVWNVPYTPGELKSIGYDNGKIVNTSILRTAAPPVSINLIADRETIHSDGEDLCYVTVELKDGNGNINPNATNLVTFKMVGKGSIVGVGNGNPLSIESDQLPQRKAWKGKCLIILKAGEQKGTMMLEARVAGLKSAQIKINVD